ncbi:hypothetical protein WICANDRAFT_45542 [Wickerhamomyces anomalus NRRL Y-366-8]|uniref:asparaginase n=1 Tax=Wickerhamomyces anomalus (strain ATCC 58044 / CBS 1984 / NCYC 433 / NRRL Y-366-8) TaxID=683960 RepID=A0A1E3NZR9_WICAA|nr:uncharacterized protein WICANDRAFT_45542 [Wickerhamomyces anomalus NRRL Y-366-8]ODQ58117.1 hypothetical protein WICANDRAFT_45542 [Wickerhamomyces anomalus NRRL Y-366-8]
MLFSKPILASILLSLITSSQAAPFSKREDTSALKNASLPTVKIFGTGGTIASRGTSGSQTAGYSLGLTVADLVDSIPDLANAANIEYIQVSNVGSPSVNYTHLIPLHHNISESLDSDEIDGAVVTHGTDTLEETAFFLDLTIKSEKPVCIVGAMRPATALSADGSMNLYQAVSIAGSEEAKGRGALIPFNDRISSAFWATKTNANTLDTFKAVEQGFLGTFLNNDVEFFYPPVRPIGYHYFDISNVTDASDIPEVAILYSHQGLDPELVRFVVEERGAKGIILAGTGAGGWTSTGYPVLQEMIEKYNIPVVRSRRTMDGSVPNTGSRSQYISSGYLNPQKARIMLQLCLHAGYDISQIKTVFSGVYGG